MGLPPLDAGRRGLGKLFAIFYALYSGVAFLAVAGLVVAPVAHRILHRPHLEEEDEES